MIFDTAHLINCCYHFHGLIMPEFKIDTKQLLLLRTHTLY